MNIHELTGQDKGIVVYNKWVIICNWRETCPNDDELPVIVFGTPIGVKQDDGIFDDAASFFCEDVRSVLAQQKNLECHGLTNLYDELLTKETSGNIYRLTNGVWIIAPLGW